MLGAEGENEVSASKGALFECYTKQDKQIPKFPIGLGAKPSLEFSRFSSGWELVLGGYNRKARKELQMEFPCTDFNSQENLHSSTDLTNQLQADANDMRTFTRRKRLGEGRCL